MSVLNVLGVLSTLLAYLVIKKHHTISAMILSFGAILMCQNLLKYKIDPRLKVVA